MPLFGSIPANQNVEVDPVWVQPNAPSAPDSGELWWDTDEVSAGITKPLGVTDGGTGATSPATARASLAVPSIGNSTTVAGPPTTGTWARGDQFLDSANVVWTCVTGGSPGVWTCPPGTELAYNQTTAQVSVTATTIATANLVIEGTSRSYDGTPVIVEMFIPNAAAMGSGAQLYCMLWDGATDLGYITGSYCQAGTQLSEPIQAKRRLTPTAGTHWYRIVALATVGSGTITAGPGGAATWNPMFVRVTKA